VLVTLGLDNTLRDRTAAIETRAEQSCMQRDLPHAGNDGCSSRVEAFASSRHQFELPDVADQSVDT